jgi:predicted DNA binding protein
VEVETVVPTGTASVSLLWVSGPERETVLTHFETSDAVDTVTECERRGDQTLYRLDGRLDEAGFLDCLRRVDGVILSAAGTARLWRLRVHVGREAAVSTLHTACQERDIDIQPRSIKQHSLTVCPEMILSQQQYEVLRVALANGYFSVPRETTLQELADTVGISDQAVSARLRRGMCRLLQAHLPDAGSDQNDPADSDLAQPFSPPPQ